MSSQKTASRVGASVMRSGPRAEHPGPGASGLKRLTRTQPQGLRTRISAPHTPSPEGILLSAMEPPTDPARFSPTRTAGGVAAQPAAALPNPCRPAYRSAVISPHPQTKRSGKPPVSPCPDRGPGWPARDRSGAARAAGQPAVPRPGLDRRHPAQAAIWTTWARHASMDRDRPSAAGGEAGCAPDAWRGDRWSRSRPRCCSRVPAAAGGSRNPHRHQPVRPARPPRPPAPPRRRRRRA